MATRDRLLYLDNLKVLLVAAAIAGHAVAGYSDLDFWPYAEMHEVVLAEPTQVVLLAVVAPATLLLIPLLFLVAGLLTPASVERKGPGAYARDRVVRLGVPFAVFVLLLQPALMYPVHPPGETPRSYWVELVGAGDQTLDTGPAWFVGVLLLFSLGYAGLVAVVHPRPGRSASREVGLGELLALAAAVAVTTFVVRLEVPLGGSNKGISLNVWEWPGCLALFGLGTVAAGHGWLSTVPDRLRRRCRAATLVALLVFAGFAAVVVALEVPEDDLWGGWGWPALVFAALESTLAVVGSVWLLAGAQRHLDRRERWAGPAVARSAYGAFLLQGVALIGLAFAMRPLPLPAEVKALLLATGSVAGSFGLAWALLRYVPGVRRVL